MQAASDVYCPLPSMFAVLSLGEWRPRLHHRFPRRYRMAMRTLVILAKARAVENEAAAVVALPPARYQQACLELLPEELLQYMYAFVTAAPVPDFWTREE